MDYGDNLNLPVITLDYALGHEESLPLPCLIDGCFNRSRDAEELADRLHLAGRVVYVNRAYCSTGIHCKGNGHMNALLNTGTISICVMR